MLQGAEAIDPGHIPVDDTSWQVVLIRIRCEVVEDELVDRGWEGLLVATIEVDAVQELHRTPIIL